jgi:hypothetical protein
MSIIRFINIEELIQDKNIKRTTARVALLKLRNVKNGNQEL